MDESKKVAILFIVIFVAVIVPATLYAGYDVSIHNNGETYTYVGIRLALLYVGLIVLLLFVIVILTLDKSTRELLHV